MTSRLIPFLLGLSLAACAAKPPAPVEYRAPPGGTPIAAAPPVAATPYEDANDADGPVTLERASASAATPEPAADVATARSAPIPGLEGRPASIEVRRGDTLYSLSETYMVSLRDLIDANKLDAPFRLNAGQTLKLPPPNTYTVQSGDTLYGVARRHRIQFRSLALLNGIKEPYDIEPGQPILLPGSARDWEATAAPVRTADLGASDRAPVTADRPPRGADPTGPAPRFVWPYMGEILSTFGPKGPGRRNDGVNIAARAGSDVQAAADGLVVYAGEELAGYGKLVLIKHADGWVSAYAHNAELLVKEEQAVTQGEVIAKAGATGAVDTAQVHFELRKAGRPVDPVSVLPKSG